jgi:hypothetical protein
MPRLIYKGDTTDTFGRYLPTPIIETVKINNVSPDEPQLIAFNQIVERGTVLPVPLDPSRMVKISLATSLIFNSNDTFSSQEYFNELLDDNETNGLYLNIIAISLQSAIAGLKEDKLQLSAARDALDANNTENDDFTIFANTILNGTPYQVFSIPFSSLVTNSELTSDYDEDGNPIFKSGFANFDFLIDNFDTKSNLSVFATVSTNSMQSLLSLSRAAFALNFSDITYEDIKINNIIAKFGDPVFVDSNNLMYPNAPMQALDSRFYKTENVSQQELTSTVEVILAQYKQLSERDKVLQKQMNNIDFVIEKFSNTPELLLNLNKSNSLSSSKSSATNTGRMYNQIRIAVNNFNAALLGEEQVVKRIYRNFKILDLREVLNFDVRPSFVEDLETDDEAFIYQNVLHSNMAKYVPITADMNYPGKAELPTNSQNRTEAYSANINALKEELKQILTDTFDNTENSDIVDPIIDEGIEWFEGYRKFWGGKDTTTTETTDLTDVETGERAVITRTQTYRRFYNKDVPEKFTEPADGVNIGTSLSDAKMTSLNVWNTRGGEGKIQLVFPRAKNARSSESSEIREEVDASTRLSNQVEDANNVIRTWSPLRFTVESILEGGRYDGSVAVLNVEETPSVLEAFPQQLRDSIFDYLTSDTRIESENRDNAVTLRFNEAVNSTLETLNTQLDTIFDSITDDGAFLNQALQENRREDLALLVYNQLLLSLSSILFRELSEELFTGFILVPISDQEGGGTDDKSQVKLARTTDSSDKGVIYGRYKGLEERFNPGYASGGSMWFKKMDFAAPIRESIITLVAEQQGRILELIEGIIEQAVTFNAIQIDTRLFDALASVDIIIKKAGYFFFDYEKFVRKRSFMSRYLNVDKMINFMPEGKEITNAAINITNVEYDNKTYNTRMMLTNETSPENPTEPDRLLFATSKDIDGSLLSYQQAPILNSAFSFKEFFNETEEIAQTIERFNPAQQYSMMVQRNFNFTGFNDGQLPEGKTWKDDYRMTMFNYQFFIDDDKYNRGTLYPGFPLPLEPSDSGNSRDVAEIGIVLQDNSYDSLVAIIDKFMNTYEVFLAEYYEPALEQCAFNSYTERFNNFFVSAITDKFPGASTPWTRMVALYALYINIFTDNFSGSYENMLEYADRTIAATRPETGTLGQLISLNESLSEFNTLLENIKSSAFIDNFTYSRTQTLVITSDIEQPILDHIGDYTELSDIFASGIQGE